jgi:hypothetical protein
MTARNVDQIRLFVTIAAVIGLAAVIGVAPSMWAAL